MFFERGPGTTPSPASSAASRRCSTGRAQWRRAAGAALPRRREYQPHYDYFDPRHASSKAILERGGQRVATLVMYLNTPEPAARRFPGLKLDVMAQKGNAVFFS
ncbi:2OG-Fe(II) oxygenase superfamily domain-containing protein [Ditylenchus destructor]|nr:2OG-Fe(II) oxygenase superfamily domain-containing protein [Ditylenchus destructor]